MIIKIWDKIKCNFKKSKYNFFFLLIFGCCGNFCCLFFMGFLHLKCWKVYVNGWSNNDALNNGNKTKALTVNTSSSPSSASFWSVEEEVVEPKIKHKQETWADRPSHILSVNGGIWGWGRNWQRDSDSERLIDGWNTTLSRCPRVHHWQHITNIRPLYPSHRCLYFI